MKMLTGYYDGLHIVIEDAAALVKGQKVHVLVADDSAVSNERLEALNKYRGICRGMLGGTDAQEAVKQLRANDRI